jgi:hypothetical protein
VWRHTFASVLIAAGVNAKAITTYMGRASIQTMYDLYGKLMPGSESDAARSSTPTLREQIRRRASRRSSLRKVDLFDFSCARLGRVQSRRYRPSLYSSTHCLVEYH